MHARHEMLRRAYNVTGTRECEELYDEWVAAYDEDTTRGMGYVGPDVVARRLAAYVEPAAVVLDAGCGTGLAGERLAALGFSTMDGVDLSAGMLGAARAKGIYRELHKADLTARLPLPDDRYDAICCVGTFTTGHVGPEGIDELLRVGRPGAVFVATIVDAVWEQRGFAGYLDGLTAGGRLRVLEHVPDSPYHEVEGITCRLCVFEVR